jgi:hypothetical protein
MEPDHDTASDIHVDGLKAKEITDFFANCNNEAYQQWRPGTHIQFHPIKGRADEIGALIYMDEFIGKRRLRMTGELIDLIPGKRFVWQPRLYRPLPVRLTIELADDQAGVRVTHVIEARYAGVGRIFDPLFRLWFSRQFAADMDGHVKTEFVKRLPRMTPHRLPNVTPHVEAS